ncbi:PepSY-associated TM helix domain-containing protein [Roseateles amylovorans]|uniref:PepSY-associated TM helix domain-containing protein n=1 Tax=Roseateles amylovorans TaxID=2978473 RepID=UPI003F496071
MLALMAITGALYLYKDEIDDLVYAALLKVEPSKQPPLAASVLIERAAAAVPGTPVRFIGPKATGRSAQVGLRTAQGMVSVYLDPVDGRVLGQLRDDLKLMEIAKQLHSMTMAGPVANHGVEIVAGWAIVLVVSGVFLWWPRRRSGGVMSVRGRPTQRLWWRDLHAVIGSVAAVAILFLAVTGMPWSAFWGRQFGQLTNDWGVGLPGYLWGKPASTPPLTSVGDTPWTMSAAKLPASTASASASARRSPTFGIDAAVNRFAGLGIPAGASIGLPVGPTGVFTAMSMPDDVTRQRVVHLDRYSGEVLADVGYRDYGAVGKAVEWGISLHTGRQFGGLNQLVMLAGCLSIVLLAVSAVVMWWKRRPQGRLGAPPRRDGDRAAFGAVAVAAALGLLYPLLGASIVVVLVLDAAVPDHWRARFGL